MPALKRTTSEDLDFQNLVKLLDKELEIRDGNEHSFYAQFNKIDKIKNVVLYFDNNIAIGCGAFREFDKTIVEIKRMFVRLEYRGNGIGVVILNELELWAAEMGYVKCILETGKMQPESIRLYLKTGYEIIPNFGQYINVENSVCMKKTINE